MCPDNIYKQTLVNIKRLLKLPVVHKVHYIINNNNSAALCAKNMISDNEIYAIYGKDLKNFVHMLSKLKSIDLAFIDGNHQEKPTIEYFEKILKYSHEKTIFIFDDIHWSKGMEKAWKYIIQNKKVSLSIDLFFATKLIKSVYIMLIIDFK